MQSARILALGFLLTGNVMGGSAVETSSPLPKAAPFEASITGPNDGQSSDAMHTFAMACGLLAFALAAQQAFFPRRSTLERVSAAKD